nr:MAG TPA: hypothetical protein [Caudoviricetes sp.]
MTAARPSTGQRQPEAGGSDGQEGKDRPSRGRAEGPHVVRPRTRGGADFRAD